MKKVVDEAKKIAGIEKMHLYLTDEEMRKQDEEYYYNKGKADGIEQGIIQTINLIQTIKKMLKQKISIEDIAKCTGKSIEDINMIINNL